MAVVTGNLKRLADGREVDSGCEEWRHECEVRHVAQMPGRAAVEYINFAQSKRGESAANAIRHGLQQMRWNSR